MRTSRISQETTRMFNALSPNARSKRATRSRSQGLVAFSLDHNGNPITQDDQVGEEQQSALSSTPPIGSRLSDIEDVGASNTQSTRSRKRKRTVGEKVMVSPRKTEKTTVKLEQVETYISPRRDSRRVKAELKNEDVSEDEDEAQLETPSAAATPRTKSKPKLPAKRSQLPDGTAKYIPPSNWELIYDTIRDFRRANPIAPVDTMGCEDLFWQTSPPAQKRYHTLTALMLSSQTKDTVTAVAMQKLHTDLLEDPERDAETGRVKMSGLTIENIIAADPVRLNTCIRQVGFHNVKTKNIKRVAEILRDQYASDIPDTIEGLVGLPGVGPKMAYLCMSAAWGVDEGIGVDVHVHRITNLWGWHMTKTPEQTREWLEGWLPKDRWHEINKMLVGLGQTVCLPIGRKCGECPLFGQGLCKAEIRGWVKKEAKKRVKKEKVEVKVEADGQPIVEKDEVVEEEENVRVKEELVDG